MTRVMTMGELTASIAHEVNQPLAGIITNANTCLRMLAADPPNIDGARETARRTIRDGNRASDVITRLRALFSRKDPANEPVDLNEADTRSNCAVVDQLQKNRVVLRLNSPTSFRLITGDRVQLQQVILNLLAERSRRDERCRRSSTRLLIRTEQDEGDGVHLTVQDCGSRFRPSNRRATLRAFYTHKDGGMGIGLSVSRSIIESHQRPSMGGPNDGPGATFSFSIRSIAVPRLRPLPGDIRGDFRSLQ